MRYSGRRFYGGYHRRALTPEERKKTSKNCFNIFWYIVNCRNIIINNIEYKKNYKIYKKK